MAPQVNHLLYRCADVSICSCRNIENPVGAAPAVRKIRKFSGINKNNFDFCAVCLKLLEKIQSNPAALQKLQNDPMLLREVGANPKLMLDLLDGKEIKQKPTKLSPATEALLKKQKETIKTPNNLNVSASNEAENNPFSENNPIKEENKNIDTATYIPKSDFIAKSSVSDAKNQELNQAFTKADKVLARAEQFIQ